MHDHPYDKYHYMSSPYDLLDKFKTPDQLLDEYFDNYLTNKKDINKKHTLYLKYK
jgi:hypothetical protein